MKTPASLSNIKSEINPKKAYAFDAQVFLNFHRRREKNCGAYGKSQKIYSQGEPAKNVLYIHKGGIKLSVGNEIGNRQSWQCLDLVTFLVRGHGRSGC